MLKQHFLKLVVGLTIVTALLASVAFGSGAIAAKAAPTQHLLACGGVGTPCGG